MPARKGCSLAPGVARGASRQRTPHPLHGGTLERSVPSTATVSEAALRAEAAARAQPTAPDQPAQQAQPQAGSVPPGLRAEVAPSRDSAGAGPARTLDHVARRSPPLPLRRASARRGSPRRLTGTFRWGGALYLPS